MRIFSITLCLLFHGILFAQGVITRMNGGNSFFRYDGNIQAVLDDAEQAVGMDTIILGGGTYLLTTDLFVQSPIVMIGTGMHPDSALAYSGRTVIDGGSNMELFVESNASGSEFHGLTFVNNVDVHLGTGTLASTNADNLLFNRCQFVRLFLGNGSNGSLADDTFIRECIMEVLDVSESTGLTVLNSVIGSVTNTLTSSSVLIENSLFMDWNLSGNAGIQYNSNIFLINSGSTFNITQQSQFQNNLFVGSGAGFNVTYGPGVVQSGNEVDYPLSGANGAFPSATVTSFTTFSHQADYTVAPQWQTLGVGGTAVGIMGGAVPWKVGSLPFNPHWTLLASPSATSNGTLQGVQIKASAQQN